MTMMTPLNEIIVFTIVLLAALAGLAVLFFVSMRRVFRSRCSDPAPPSGLDREGDPSKIDPWLESGRRMTVENGETPDFDSDDERFPGGRFE